MTGRFLAQATQRMGMGKMAGDTASGGEQKLRFALSNWCFFQHSIRHPASGSEWSAHIGLTLQLVEGTHTDRAALPHATTAASAQGVRKPEWGDST